MKASDRPRSLDNRTREIARKKLRDRSGDASMAATEAILGSLSETERSILSNLKSLSHGLEKYIVPMDGAVLDDAESMQKLCTAPMNERVIVRSLVTRLHGSISAA